MELGDSDYDGVALVSTIGYDLDGACTREGHATCSGSAWAIGDRSDYPGGRDNAFGRVLYQTYRDNRSHPEFVSITATSNRRTAEGLLSMAIRVRGYNDADDDDQVEVDVMAVTLMAEDGELAGPPAWDGSDAWRPLDASLEPAPEGQGNAGGGRFRAKYTTADAFVADRMLVAHLDELLVSTGVLSHVVLTATVARDVRGPWALREGTIAGRHRADDLLAGLWKGSDAEPDLEPPCTGSPEYELRKRILCSFADISFDGTNDGSAPCDALSWAWRFQSEPVRLSDEVAMLSDVAASEPRRCPEASAPVLEGCPTL